MSKTIVHLASGDLWAGAEVQLLQLVSQYTLSQENILIVVLFNSGQLEAELNEKDVEVIVLDEKIFSSFAIARKFLTIVKESNADIIHTHGFKENVLGGIVGWLVGCKSVRTEHGASEFLTMSFSPRRFVSAFLDEFSGKLFQQRIIAVSDELKDKLTPIYSASKITVIENSLNFERLREQSLEKINLTLSESQFNIGFVGRFVSVKRIDRFYDIAKKTIELNPESNIHFYMIGDGPLWNDLDKKIKLDKMDNKIHLIGFVQNSAPYIKLFNLLLFTSDHEGLPMTLLETMSLAVPIMSTNLPTVKKVLCDGECGFIIDSNKVDDFVAAIANIVVDSSDALSKATQAQRILEKNYSIEKNIQQYVSLYDEISV